LGAILDDIGLGYAGLEGGFFLLVVGHEKALFSGHLPV
jgi:hypothetical protein